MALEYRHVLAKFIPAVNQGRGPEKFYSLPVFVCAGLMFMASAVDFVLLFVSLELVTIGFYALVAYTRRHQQSLEAGVKYLILGALVLVFSCTALPGFSASPVRGT